MLSSIMLCCAVAWHCKAAQSALTHDDSVTVTPRMQNDGRFTSAEIPFEMAPSPIQAPPAGNWNDLEGNNSQKLSAGMEFIARGKSYPSLYQTQS